MRHTCVARTDIPVETESVLGPCVGSGGMTSDGSDPIPSKLASHCSLQAAVGMLSSLPTHNDAEKRYGAVHATEHLIGTPSRRSALMGLGLLQAISMLRMTSRQAICTTKRLILALLIVSYFTC